MCVICNCWVKEFRWKKWMMCLVFKWIYSISNLANADGKWFKRIEIDCNLNTNICRKNIIAEKWSCIFSMFWLKCAGLDGNVEFDQWTHLYTFYWRIFFDSRRSTSLICRHLSTMKWLWAHLKYDLQSFVVFFNNWSVFLEEIAFGTSAIYNIPTYCSLSWIAGVYMLSKNKTREYDEVRSRFYLLFRRERERERV